jgi:DNA-directed RNA polymerase specialized sigma24 family protein
MFVLYNDQLVRDASRRVPAADAPDVVMAMWASKPALAPDLSPLRCLRQSLRQQISNYRCKQVPSPSLIEATESPCWGMPIVGAPELVDLKEQIAHCLGYLTQRQARALELVYLQGASHAVAGAAMKISENALANLVSRSLNRLKRCMMTT